MDYSGNVWITILMYGLQYLCMDYNTYVWITILMYGLQYLCMDYSGNVWITIVIFALQAQIKIFVFFASTFIAFVLYFLLLTLLCDSQQESTSTYRGL